LIVAGLVSLYGCYAASWMTALNAVAAAEADL